MIRVAAIGDLHIAEDSGGQLAPHWPALAREADVLLLAGDLTNFGNLQQARVLQEELADLPIPAVAVLGNHDYHAGNPDCVSDALREVGISVLEGDTVSMKLEGCTLGIAGAKGFGGGFPGACGHAFGEPEMKAFMHLTDAAADSLERGLRSLQTDYRLALMHYAPVKDTLQGERLEIYPFLGSYRLAEALDRAGADLAVHGHAHHGCEKGLTPGGIPVRNVAMPLLRRPYVVYELLHPHRAGMEAAAVSAS